MSFTPWRSKVIKDCFSIIILFGFLSFLWLSTKHEKDDEPASTFRENVISYFETYYDSELKIVEDNLLLEDEYEDEEFSTVYENKKESERIDNIQKAPSDDELDKIFEHRRQVMRRGCSVLQKIQDQMTVGSFESLLQLHRTIYDVSQPIPEAWKNSGDCAPDNLPQSSVRLVADPFKILICLPPKCGTTNWQRGMNTLHFAINGKKREPETFYPPSLYSVLPVLSTKQIGNGKNRSMRWDNKVANTRNPFARLFSAWNDKGRTHLDKHGDISFDDFSGSRILALVEQGKTNEARKRMKSIIADKAHHFHAPYWAGIKPFQTSPPPDGRNSSFEAFAEYIGSNPGNSKMNHHWRTLYGQCGPCAVEYEYITHLEESLFETPYLLKRLGVDKQTHIPGKYSWSPAGREEMKWSTVPRVTAEKIYQHYFADFVLFGYSPDEVLGFINATRSDLKGASPTQRAQSRSNLFEMRRKYIANFQEGCQQT